MILTTTKFDFCFWHFLFQFVKVALFLHNKIFPSIGSTGCSIQKIRKQKYWQNLSSLNWLYQYEIKYVQTLQQIFWNYQMTHPVEKEITLKLKRNFHQAAEKNMEKSLNCNDNSSFIITHCFSLFESVLPLGIEI